MRIFGSGVLARNIALTGSAGQAVLTKASRLLAAAIKTGDYLAVQVDHLASGVDAQSGACVVDDRRRPSGIERRLGDLVERLRLAEVLVLAESTNEL